MNISADQLRANSRKYQDLIKNFEKQVGKDTARVASRDAAASGEMAPQRTRPKPPISRPRQSLAPRMIEQERFTRPRVSLAPRMHNVDDVLEEPPPMFEDASDDESIDNRLDESIVTSLPAFEEDYEYEADDLENLVDSYMDPPPPTPSRIPKARPSMAPSSFSALPAGFATATPAVRRKLGGRASIAPGGHFAAKTLSSVGALDSVSRYDEFGHRASKHHLDEQDDRFAMPPPSLPPTRQRLQPRPSLMGPPLPPTRRAPRPSLPRGNISLPPVRRLNTRQSHIPSNIPSYTATPRKSPKVPKLPSPATPKVQYEHHSPGQDTSFNSDVVLVSPTASPSPSDWTDEHTDPAMSMEASPAPPSPSLEIDSDLVNSDTVVCLRTRPLLEREVTAGWYSAITNTQNTFFVHQPTMHWKGPQLQTAEFKVDLAFGADDSNQVVYDRAIKGSKMLEMVIGGGVGCVFAYGQTGSGKTFTMTALQEGIARDIFNEADRLSEEDGEEDRIFKIHVSFFELLGKEAFDLLNDRSPVRILEDVHGSVQIPGLTEYEINTSDEFESLISAASVFRKTFATLKNDVSSRSHAVCHVRIENTKYLSAENGKLLIVDLAGSERAADSMAHDKARMDETKEINKSLMTLKDCIRGRALAALNLDKHVHVPYRTSRLTILLKDAFELATSRVCKTIVIAHCSPSINDAAHSLNTLRYAQPFKIAVPKDRPPPDPKNPANWSHEQMQDWIRENSKWVKPEVLCPFESGLQLTRLPEAEWIRRCCLCPNVSQKGAKQFYVKLWGLVIDARTQKREEKLKKLASPKDDKKIKAKKSANPVPPPTMAAATRAPRQSMANTTSRAKPAPRKSMAPTVAPTAAPVRAVAEIPLDPLEAKEREKDLWRQKLKEMRENKGMKMSIKDAGVTATTGLHSRAGAGRVALSPRGN